MILALLSVILYLTELQGVWGPDTEGVYHVLMIGIDVIFLCDLGLKIIVQKKRYVLSPWFVIDFLSTVPVLGSIFQFLGFDPALRAIRGFRFLRSIRGLRTIRILKELRLINTTINTQEQKRYHQVLTGSVIVFAGLFVWILKWTQQNYPAEDVPQYEFFLVLGTMLGITLLLIVVRFMLPAMSMGQIHQLLNVALPKQVAHHFIRDPSLYHRTVRMPASIIFCDIQGFTNTVEKLDSDLQQLKDHLEKAMEEIVSKHISNDLIVDKFIGDAVMSFRGGNLVTGTPKEHAYRVVRASIESLQAIKKLNNPYFNKVRIGGASSEKALIGTFGTAERLSYTILGDRVNLAARLESMCKETQTLNLFCDNTYELTKDCTDILWRRYGTVAIRGKKERITVYEAFDQRDTVAPKWLSLFHQALDAFEAEDFQTATKHFQSCIESRAGGDPPSHVYIQRIAAMVSKS